MKQHGRKSAASASVTLMPGKRPDPPKDMPPDQATLWRQVVNTKPATWFTADSFPILTQFVRHVSTATLLEQRIAELDGCDISEIDKWLALRDRESKIILRLAASMRLTQNSRIKAETAATQHDNAGDAGKPWEAAAD